MSSTFDEMLELARRVGISVRHARLGGSGGGLACIRGTRQLFVDLDADPMDQLEHTARALAQISEVDAVFVRPDVRQILDQLKSSGEGAKNAPK